MTDPKDEIEALKRRIAELEALQAAQTDLEHPTRIKTDGGAAIGGGVRVANGHFIGRDYVASVTHIVQAGEDKAHVENVIALYLHTLCDHLAGLRLGEIDGSLDHSRREPLQLSDVYVPLNTTLRIDSGSTLHDHLAQPRSRPTAAERLASVDERRAVTALEALAEHPKLTLLGDAGGGKSSFGARILLALAEVWRGNADELAHLGDTWAAGPLFPIRVVLRSFADQLPAGTKPARAGDLWAFIGRELRDCGVGLMPEDSNFLQRLALSHGALVLFDGLDECGSAERRARVQAAVDEFIRTHAQRSRFLLTARPYAFPKGADPQQGVYRLDAFDDTQIVRFIETWYAMLPKRGWCKAVDAERKCADLLDARQRHDLRPLTSNPLLLTLMALLHSNRGQLPDDRVDLYHESVELLLQRWNPASGVNALRDELAMPQLKLADVREVLQRLAFELHEESAGRQGALDIGEGRLLAALTPLLDGDRNKAATMVEYIERRTGLLIGQGASDLAPGRERQFTFPHRTFREYLAACHLAASNHFTRECLRLTSTDAAHWQVVLPLAARVAKLDRGAAAAHGLIGCEAVDAFMTKGKPPRARQWAQAQLAGLQLAELGVAALNSRADTKTILQHVRHWLAAALPVHPDDGGLPAVERAKLGDVLAELGDPRFDPERLYLPADPDLGFVQIPADPQFRIGTGPADRKRVAKAADYDPDDDEINGALTPTPEFWITRYPVTVAQFRAFVEDSGSPLGDADALRDADTRPVCLVSWDEARAYADWLQRQLREAPVFDDNPVAALVRAHGWQVMLPSERAWEKAARGGREGAVFPWGDVPDRDRANIDDSGIGDTSAVGAFPPNDYGLYDMVGNVWEWTRTEHGAPYSAPEPEASSESNGIVVRGGGWNDLRSAARCAVRDGLRPVIRNYLLGFRVVLCCSPVR
jgi:formylglycine-generating enzyme required for sulfatase activity